MIFKRIWLALKVLFGWTPIQVKELLLPEKTTQSIANLGPYRSEAKLAEARKTKVLAIVDYSYEKCPICKAVETKNYYGTIIADHSVKFCTPFRRIMLKYKWFGKSIYCNLSKPHYHCKCHKSNCKTEWLVFKGEEPNWQEVGGNDCVK